MCYEKWQKKKVWIILYVSNLQMKREGVSRSLGDFYDELKGHKMLNLRIEGISISIKEKC